MRVCSGDEVIALDGETPAKGSRLAELLGDMRREKNGAVADFMRFYGDKYGLNYGVSLPTVRAIARAQAECASALENHKFAKQLYRQQVRELRLAALYLADSESIDSVDDLVFWAKGVINSEVAEEAAFALMYRVSLVELWLTSENALLQYCAVMSLAKRCEQSAEVAQELLLRHSGRLLQIIDSEPHLTPKAVVALLDTAMRIGVQSETIQVFLSSLKKGSAAANYITEEISWRLELR